MRRTYRENEKGMGVGLPWDGSSIPQAGRGRIAKNGGVHHIIKVTTNATTTQKFSNITKGGSSPIRVPPGYLANRDANMS